MGLRGTLGYNMNILTALVELLVKKKLMPFHGINIRLLPVVLIDFLLWLPQ
jgi:hypothetical protein